MLVQLFPCVKICATRDAVICAIDFFLAFIALFVHAVTVIEDSYVIGGQIIFAFC